MDEVASPSEYPQTQNRSGMTALFQPHRSFLHAHIWERFQVSDASNRDSACLSRPLIQVSCPRWSISPEDQCGCHHQAENKYQDTVGTPLKLACMRPGSKTPSVLFAFPQAVCLHSRIHGVTDDHEHVPIQLLHGSYLVRKDTHARWQRQT